MISSNSFFRNALRSAFCLLLLLLGLWFPLPALNVVAAPLCTGHGCDGLNPETMGCGSDATTGTWKDLGNGRAEHRLSSACDAKWERTRLTSGTSKYAAGSLRYGCANYCYDRSVRSPAKIAVGAQVYTPMQGDDSIPTRACGRLSDTGPISIPVPVSDTYCSGVN
jgi:hypothetical protein